jgi:hypothetical protein
MSNIFGQCSETALERQLEFPVSGTGGGMENGPVWKLLKIRDVSSRSGIR